MKYVVAVSGGIDSVVLLDKLVREAKYDLVVAHVDHGIRPDSPQDAQLVKELAAEYGLVYEQTALCLGTEASEDRARQARYAWLREIITRYQADALVTAHHFDDVIETMLINTVRGTGWRGLVSLRSSRQTVRPLLALTKADIIRYAIEHDLRWHEDSTNQDVRYLRNYFRHGKLKALSAGDYGRLKALYDTQRQLRMTIEAEVSRLASLCIADETIARYWLIMTPPVVAKELLRQWLGQPIESAVLERILYFAKVARPGKQFSFAQLRLYATTRFIKKQR